MGLLHAVAGSYSPCISAYVQLHLEHCVPHVLAAQPEEVQPPVQLSSGGKYDSGEMRACGMAAGASQSEGKQWC